MGGTNSQDSFVKSSPVPCLEVQMPSSCVLNLEVSMAIQAEIKRASCSSTKMMTVNMSALDMTRIVGMPAAAILAL
jgi:hypothetical protein